jgi:3-oxoacyl-[acyl-carrier protein] reductase
MDLEIKDRVAIVTGGSRGLGRVSALALAREGVNVAICGRTQSTLDETVAEMKSLGVSATGVVADISDPPSAQEVYDSTVAELGAVDILVNNVGGRRGTTIMNTTEEQFKAGFEFNLFGALRLMRLVLPGMKENRWGRIINISSIFGKQPGTGMIDYNATKAAVISLTKTLADELAKDNVLVNAVCPGPVRTPLWQEAAKIINPQDPEGMIAGFAAANIPMGRFGRPEEIASLVTFLASERSSFITGAAYDIDGGMVKYMV